MKAVAFSFTLVLFVLVIPTVLCFIHSRQPQWFFRWRQLLWLLGTAAFSWLWINSLIWVPYCLGLTRIRGPEAVFAMFFGWLYLWVAMLPVMTLYLLYRLILRIWR